MITRATIHIILHFLVPAGISFSLFRKFFLMTWLIMMLAMIIDLDHFLADPIYDPNRCSINFHPFHTYWALTGYCALLLIPKTRILGIGLLVHFILDSMDCIWMVYLK
jgi:hypothetical protein